MYADDLKIYTISDPSLLQSALDSVSDWSSTWGLSISYSKTVVMRMGKSHPPFSFSINGHTLPIVDEFKDLGVAYTNKLDFTPHIQSIVSRANARCAYIHRSFSTRSLKIYTLLFSTYVRPILEYCSDIWNPTTPGMVKLIESVQRRYSRIVFRKCGLRYVEYPERLRALGLPTLANRRHQADLVQTFKIIHGFLDILPRSVFHFPTTTRNRRGHSLVIMTSRCRSQQSVAFLSNRIVSAWNHLSSSVVLSESIHSFRSSLAFL